ncbi:MAG TPA: YgeY family selenium metabolism-linked hydrolase [Acidimicrobiales bacterium]|nr:YgeY family selenium metabolism-linked hydrolase [Acidimicrobiales bacterium]
MTAVPSSTSRSGERSGTVALTPERVRAEAERHRAAAVELLRDVIHRPSLSGEEGDVVSRLRHEMEELGFDEIIEDPLGSAVGRIGSGPTVVVYDSHVDTVDVGSRGEWFRDPFEPALEGGLDGGTVHGRGASDDKAGICSMIHGAALARDLGQLEGVTLYVVGSVQEETCDGLALEQLLTTVIPRPEVVVLGEATRCQLYRGHRGRIEVAVTATGESCHASAPERGHNPVYDLALVMSEIEQLNTRLGYDEFLGSGSVAVTKIECETPSLNAVPSTATLYLDRRLTLGESAETALEELRSLPAVQRAGASVTLLGYEKRSYTGATARAEKYFPTWVTPESHRSVQVGVAACEAALGRTPEIGHWVFSTNGCAAAGRLGLPTIGFGPGDEVHAHSAHDQCPTDDVVEAIAFLAMYPGTYRRWSP